MSDNEITLEQTLNQYKDELTVVVSALNCDQNNNDLIELKDKLIEIIALTEVELLNEKKARLLSEINSIEDNCEPKASTSGTEDKFLINSEDITNRSLIETLEELNGKECRVAVSEQNGVISEHNAVVMTAHVLESVVECSETLNFKVKVFFTYPMNNSMVPCPHFMSGKCRFEQKCRYSHGYDVCLKDIKPLKPIDYSLISRDSICLVKSKIDSLWHKAVVEGVSEEQIVVKYCDSDLTDNIDIEDILPLNDNENCIQTETNSELQLNNSINDESDDISVIQWSSDSSAIGSWEIHTKGIGSKLLSKMGYIFGKGLGRNGEGITQPIDVFVFPNGKSLDVCIEMKEKFLSNDELKQKIKIKQKKIENRIANGYNRVRPEDTVFDFINQKILTTKESSTAEPKSKPMTASELKATNTQSLNISSFKISEDIRRAEFELKRLNDSMLRNKTKDKVLFNQLQDKIHKQNKLILNLKQKESMIQREQNSRTNKQKLSIF